MELGAKRHVVRGDPARLQQVFWNLIGNAMKFTPEGGSVIVRTSDQADEKIRVEIIDTGIGIEAEVLPRLFNAFEQADSSLTRKFSGLGLGLTIAKGLMDAHGGTLTAASAGINQGTTFTVEMGTVAVAAQRRRRRM